MFNNNFMVIGVVLLLCGIALWLYGFNLAPTTGGNLSTFFQGAFTDRSNGLMSVGLVLGVLRAAGIASATVSGRKPRTV